VYPSELVGPLGARVWRVWPVEPVALAGCGTGGVAGVWRVAPTDERI